MTFRKFPLTKHKTDDQDDETLINGNDDDVEEVAPLKKLKKKPRSNTTNTKKTSHNAAARSDAKKSPDLFADEEVDNVKNLLIKFKVLVEEIDLIKDSPVQEAFRQRVAQLNAAYVELDSRLKDNPGLVVATSDPLFRELCKNINILCGELNIHWFAQITKIFTQFPAEATKIKKRLEKCKEFYLEELARSRSVVFTVCAEQHIINMSHYEITLDLIADLYTVANNALCLFHEINNGIESPVERALFLKNYEEMLTSPTEFDIAESTATTSSSTSTKTHFTKKLDAYRNKLDAHWFTQVDSLLKLFPADSNEIGIFQSQREARVEELKAARQALFEASSNSVDVTIPANRIKQFVGAVTLLRSEITSTLRSLKITLPDLPTPPKSLQASIKTVIDSSLEKVRGLGCFGIFSCCYPETDPKTLPRPANTKRNSLGSTVIIVEDGNFPPDRRLKLRKTTSPKKKAERALLLSDTDDQDDTPKKPKRR